MNFGDVFARALEADGEPLLRKGDGFSHTDIETLLTRAHKDPIMTEPALANLTVEAAYRDRTPGSAALAARARSLFPSGITHDGRHLEPYGVYIERGEGPYKWDVDGNRYIDYYGGHGALLLGHNHPQVAAAVQSALERGTHFGASHALEVRWAKAIQGLMPSAERIRFTSSGTEATLMAVRLARSFTGRRKILRIRTHFHGWHDHMTSGYQSHFDGAATVGVLPGVAEQVVLADPNDVDGLRAILASDREIAAAIVEPTGGSFGMVPLAPSFVTALRELTAAHGALLIFDEVVTGFRVAPGGAQGHFGITPDLTTLAKVVAGGMPGGAVAGRADVLAALDFAATAAAGAEKIQHPGTFNANPVSAAAGIAALDVIASTDACDRANASAAMLRQGFNEVLEDLGVPWAAYGTFSSLHLFTNAKGRALRPAEFDPFAIPYAELKARQGRITHRLRIAMLLHGVDLNNWPGAVVSAVLSDQDVADTIDAFRDALHLLRREGDLG